MDKSSNNELEKLTVAGGETQNILLSLSIGCNVIRIHRNVSSLMIFYFNIYSFILNKFKLSIKT